MTDKYTVQYSFGGGSELFNAMDTVRIIEEHDALETQLRTTSLAKKMLQNIGVKCK